MDILNVVSNIFLEQSEFWWFAFVSFFIFGHIWTVWVDDVDTVAADIINDLQDCKVDTDEVPILQNILGGSDFGVWSQSDANKGLASVTVDSGSVYPSPGETVTGATSGAVGKVMWMDNDAGNWGGGTGTGDIKLGAVTGTFQDNENLNGTDAGANFATVNGDTSIGVDNDPCNNDSTGDWTQDGDGLVFDTSWYEWATSAVTKYCYKGSLNFERGHIYKIEIEMRDGAAAPTDLQIYFYDGAEQVGPDIDTANPGGAFTKYTWTFECATTTAAGRAGIKAPTSLGGNEIDFQDFSCYEITPGCTAVDSKAWDGDEWTKDSTLDIYREHWDGGTNTKEGSFYTLRCVPSAVSDYINWKYDLRSEGEHLAKFYGKTVIMGMWAKTSLVNHFRIGIYEQGGANAYSDYHPGDGNWHWLEVPYTFGTTATWLYIQLRCNNTPNIDGSSIVYLSQPMLIFCNAIDGIIGEGNYVPKPQEFIWGKKAIPSNAYDGLLAQGDLAFTDLNLEADSDAMLPKGAKVIAVLVNIDDTGSGAGIDVHVELRRDATSGGFFVISVAGKPNDIHDHMSGLQPCDENGDVDIHLDASGAGNLNINQFEYHGVQVN